MLYYQRQIPICMKVKLKDHYHGKRDINKIQNDQPRRGYKILEKFVERNTAAMSTMRWAAGLPAQKSEEK